MLGDIFLFLLVALIPSPSSTVCEGSVLMG